MARAYDTGTGSTEPVGEIDLRAINSAVRRRRRAVLIPTVLAFVLVSIFVNVVSPRYTAETQVLLENQETFFTRPDRSNGPTEQISQLDAEAVASQVQLVSSRDLARRAITQLKLKGNPEFDALADGMNPVTRALVLLGLAHDPSRETADARIVTAFLDKLTVFSPPKTRVITIQFSSKDPVLAAKAADTVASLYLQEQSAAKRDTAKDSAESLASQIADLREKLAKADADRETYRLQSGLLSGTNNMTISGQQLADINTDLSRARTTRADAQAKASMIRQLLREGKAADVTEVINNDIVRRVSDQRVTAQAQLALESRTLLPGHPRIKELSAQVAQFDLALKGAARQAAATLENEAKIAGQRVANLEAVMNQQKQVAGVANTDEVHLRALERTAQAIKDQLDSSSTKYQEALARQSSLATPADARVIARAAIPQEASFPKKLPFIAFGTIAAFVLSLGYVVADELLSGQVPLEVRAGARDDETDVKELTEPLAARERVPARRDRPSTDLAHDKAVPHRPEAVDPKPELQTPRSRRFLSRAGFRPPQAVTAALGERAEPDPVFAPVAARPRITDGRWTTASLLGIAAGAIAYLKAFGRSAIESRPAASEVASEMPPSDVIGWDPAPALDPIERRQGERRARDRRKPIVEAGVEPHHAAAAMTEPTAPDGGAVPLAGRLLPEAAAVESDATSVAPVVERIVAAHVPGRGLHIVGAGLDAEAGATNVVIELSRALAEKGRAVIVDLNRTPMKLASLAALDAEGLATITTIHGLSELLAGDASFAEVIHRDHGSRLHFIPAGLRDADFRDFDLILDALSETYDFIVMLTPAFPQSEIAKVMAPYADFVVLAAVSALDEEKLAMLENDLIEAGAQHVLVAGTSRSRRALKASA